MTKPKMSLWFFFIAGLFVGVGIFAAVRGRLNAAFLGVAAVFFVLALATRRKETGGPGGSASA
jgi:hypothetical protein